MNEFSDDSEELWKMFTSSLFSIIIISLIFFSSLGYIVYLFLDHPIIHL